MEKRLNDPKSIWKEFKTIVNPNKGSIATCIISQAEQETSP